MRGEQAPVLFLHLALLGGSSERVLSAVWTSLVVLTAW